VVKNFNHYYIYVRSILIKAIDLKTEILTQVWETAKAVSDFSWTKTMTIGVSFGVAWEWFTGAIDDMHMTAGIAAFWAIIFSGVAKLFSQAIKNTLERKYPKLFKKPKDS